MALLLTTDLSLIVAHRLLMGLLFQGLAQDMQHSGLRLLELVAVSSSYPLLPLSLKNTNWISCRWFSLLGLSAD